MPVKQVIPPHPGEDCPTTKPTPTCWRLSWTKVMTVTTAVPDTQYSLGGGAQADHLWARGGNTMT